jgi:hypothetical protein
MKSGVRALFLRHGEQSIAVTEHDWLRDGDTTVCIRTGKARWQ